MGIELNNDQIYAIYDLEHWWKRGDKQLFEITGGAGCGKAQPESCEIPTPKGKKYLKDINVGDYIFDRHGSLTQVNGIFLQGKKKVYSVIFDDDRSTRCCIEHLWTYTNDENKLETAELGDLIKSELKNPDGSYRYRVPLACPVEFTERIYDFDPYTMGILMSNEFDNKETIKKGHLYFHLENKYVTDRLGYILSVRLRLKSLTMREEGHCETYKIYTDEKLYKFGLVQSVCGNYRSIPINYKYGLKRQRWELIQGLFDSTGDVEEIDGTYCVTYRSPYQFLVSDVKDVLQSLGISSKLVDDHFLVIQYTNGYANMFFTDLEKRKKCSELCTGERYYHYITNVIEESYEEDMRCLYVDNDEHLYLTDNYIVTHNTTMVRYFIERLGLTNDQVLFVAFMGKAASVLQRNGVPAKTIHSAIYDYKERMSRDENGKIIIKSNGKPKLEHYFELKDHISKKIKLIVLDEASMVDQKIGEDLMSFGIPIITLGDLNQLPPVFGKPFFLRNPDVRLHQIMRQAEGNPIIWLAQEVLQGHQLKRGVYGNSAIIGKRDITEFHFRNNDIIITGTNRLRYNINNYCREYIKGIKNLEYPHINEKVICRKNNWSQCIGDGIYLTNGTTGFVDFIYRDSFNKNTMKMDFRPDFTKKVFKNVEFDYNHLYAIPGSEENKETPFGYLYDKIEYAYAITAHASQGSTYPRVLYMHEDFMRDPEDRKKLLYTAITRASESETIVL